MAEVQLALLPADDAQIANIIESVQSQAYEEALSLIEQYLAESSTALVKFQDAELDALRLQLKELEEVIELLREQKSDQLFLLREFNTQQSLATGDIAQQILHLRKEIEAEKLRQKQLRREAAQQALEAEKSILEELKQQRAELEEQLEELDELDSEFEDIEEQLDRLNEDIRQQRKTVKEKHQEVMEDSLFEETDESTYEEAKQEYERYEKTYHEAQEDKVAQLSPEDAGLLKSLYRKAARLCHPDITAEEFKDQATEIMGQLNQAREQGDIAAVKSILVKLESGTAFMLASDQLTDKEQIKAKIHELAEKLEDINREIEAINEDETWRLITSLDSWDGYFQEVKSELEIYLQQLQQEYGTLLNPPETTPAQTESEPSENYSSQEDGQGSDSYWDEEF